MTRYWLARSHGPTWMSCLITIRGLRKLNTNELKSRRICYSQKMSKRYKAIWGQQVFAFWLSWYYFMIELRWSLQHLSEQKSKMPLTTLEYITPSLKLWNSFPQDLHVLIILETISLSQVYLPWRNCFAQISRDNLLKTWPNRSRVKNIRIECDHKYG